MAQSAPVTIQSPIPGVFYRRPNPESECYVNEGDRVKPGDIVCLVEVMKQFFELKSDREGVISRFLLQDGDGVDIGQDLIEFHNPD